MNSYTIGILSGLTASLITYLTRRLIGRLLIAIGGGFSERNLSGKWTVKLDGSVEEQATVYQLFSSVWGIIYDPATKIYYSFSGNLKNNVLVATYKAEGKKIIDPGTFTLIPNATGELTEMKGTCSWVEDKKPISNSGKYIWKKDRA